MIFGIMIKTYGNQIHKCGEYNILHTVGKRVIPLDDPAIARPDNTDD